MPCAYCKANHESESCPLYLRSLAYFRSKTVVQSESFFGSSPAPFVGRFGYPNIHVGVLTPPEINESWLHDAPKFWSAQDFAIPQIVDLRSALVNSRFKAHVKEKSKWLELSQEVGMASKPVDLEVVLTKKPMFRITTDIHAAPMGPSAELKKAQITSNPKINTKVDKVVSDTDLLAKDAMEYLYSKGFDELFLNKLLSVGTLGVNRKLVPTRWSITATDDIIGKQVLESVKQFPEANYTAYYGSYLGNHYLMLFFSTTWSYELFENYLPALPKWQYSTDYEPFEGRKNYAENTVGGYYTVRLSLAEKMNELKRQAGVLALRFIDDNYTMPLGVWVTREAARKALSSKPIEFASKELLLKYAHSFVKKKFGFNLDMLLPTSRLLKNLERQSKLSNFLQ